MKILIGLTGEKGSGKDTFAELVKESAQAVSVGRCRSSEILSETLDMWHIQKTRRNLQELAIVMDKGFGLGTLTNALYERILKLEEDIVLFDAVRWQSDVEMIRKFPKSFIIYITAPLEIRYERTKKRKEKIAESAASFEQFKQEEQVATELQITQIGKKADIKIENSGEIAEFKREVEKIWIEKIKPLL